jgi:F0F1-type ATP synthase membrane subunit b/b'
MRRYLLEDLVRVREHREEQASERVTRARRLLLEAEAARTHAQKALAEYTVWRVAEEQRRLNGLMRRLLKLGELSDERQEIALLREREFEFVDRVKQADAAVAKAEAHLEETRQQHAQALRELEKLLEHRSLWQREQARELERAEELELEDFTTPTARSISHGGFYESN